MAQLERATSSRGKKYFASGVVKYDEIEAKTIRVGGANNQNGTIEVLDSTNIQKVLVNKDGITLSNGAELINGNGVLVNLQYVAFLQQLGFVNDNSSGLSLMKAALKISAYIPTDFTIDSVYLSVRAYKTKNYYALPDTPGDSTEEYGKVTNIKLYKATTSADYIYSDFGFWGTDPSSAPTLTEISGAFGASGYTNATTAEVTFTSTDITSSLAVGQNDIWVQTSDSVPTPYNDANVTVAAQKSQSAIAILNVIGYKK